MNYYEAKFLQNEGDKQEGRVIKAENTKVAIERAQATADREGWFFYSLYSSTDSAKPGLRTPLWVWCLPGETDPDAAKTRRRKKPVENPVLPMEGILEQMP